MPPNRRQVLAAAATAASVGFTDRLEIGSRAPLQTETDDEMDGLPAYSEWLTLADDGLEFVAVDWASVDDDVRAELEGADPDEEVPPEYEDDPMVVPASEGVLGAYFAVGLDLAQYRLGRLLEEEAFDSTVEELLLVNDAVIAAGEIDPAEIDAEVTAEPPADFITQFEVTDAIGDYDVYTPVDADVDAALAVADAALLFVDGADLPADAEPVSRLETIVSAAEDGDGRATDESEAVEWLVGTGGDGDIAVGQYGDRVTAEADGGVADVTFPGLEDAEGVVTSLTVEDETTATGSLAAIVDDPDVDTITNVVGAAGEDREIEIEDDRVTATATYRDPEVTAGRLEQR